MSAPQFYRGVVGHQRFGDKLRHKLRYKIAYVLVDLDDLNTGTSPSRWLSYNDRGLMSVNAKDHGDGESSDLAEWVRRQLKRCGVHEPASKIELLTLPRMFGFVFNPISVYFIYGDDAAAHHVLYEVNNTFGGRQFYLCPASLEAGRFRHNTDKTFYVSPFMDVVGRYEFTVLPPAEKVALNIRYFDKEDDLALVAHLSGAAEPVNNKSALSVLAAYPLMTIGVVAGIHWEAIKLFIKGARYHPYAPHKRPPQKEVNRPQSPVVLSETRTRKAA
ncbi:MAG: DUF1365 domain-containing protein [Pseudomonadota bacterium]